GFIAAVEDNRSVFSKADDPQMASLQGPFQNWQLRRFLAMQGRTVGRNEAWFRDIIKDLRTVEAMQGIFEMTKRTDQARAAKALAAALQFEAWKYDPKLPKDDLYFGGTTKTEDLLDFLVWQHQADKLGIALDEEAVIREANREAGGRDVLEGKKFADE